VHFLKGLKAVYDLVFIAGWKKASALSFMFGLNEDYFTQASRLNSLPKDWETMRWDGTNYIKPPERVRHLIDSGYKAFKVNKGDEVDSDCIVIKIGRSVSVGFWK